jgi:hypothetical protein
MIGIIIWSFITGLGLGLFIHMWFIRSVMKNNPNELIDAIEEYHRTHTTDDEDIDDPNSIIVSFEHVNSHWYLYDVSTNIFAGQGKSLDEAIAAVKARFPNKEVVVQQISEAS